MALALAHCSIEADQGGTPHARERVSWEGRSPTLLFMVPLGLPSARPMAQALQLPLEYYIFIAVCIHTTVKIYMLIFLKKLHRKQILCIIIIIVYIHMKNNLQLQVSITMETYNSKEQLLSAFPPILYELCNINSRIIGV